jgi:hypothetical protein
MGRRCAGGMHACGRSMQGGPGPGRPSRPAPRLRWGWPCCASHATPGMPLHAVIKMQHDVCGGESPPPPGGITPTSSGVSRVCPGMSNSFFTRTPAAACEVLAVPFAAGASFLGAGAGGFLAAGAGFAGGLAAGLAADAGSFFTGGCRAGGSASDDAAASPGVWTASQHCCSGVCTCGCTVHPRGRQAPAPPPPPAHLGLHRLAHAGWSVVASRAVRSCLLVRSWFVGGCCWLAGAGLAFSVRRGGRLLLH